MMSRSLALRIQNAAKPVEDVRIVDKMSEFKGTKGPYRVHVADDGFPSVLVGKFVVAGVDGIANAHLLAASFELLEAAQAVCNSLDYSSDTEPDMPLIADLRAACAKALNTETK